MKGNRPQETQNETSLLKSVLDNSLYSTVWFRSIWALNPEWAWTFVWVQNPNFEQATRLCYEEFCSNLTEGVCVSLSCVWLFATPWTVACPAPPSMGFSRQEYWSELPFPSPGDLLNPWIKPSFSALQVDSLPSEASGKPKRVLRRKKSWGSHQYSSPCSPKPISNAISLIQNDN